MVSIKIINPKFQFFDRGKVFPKLSASTLQADDLKEAVCHASHAAKLGGQILLDGFGQGITANKKAGADVVTVADIASEYAIVDHLKPLYPHFSILSEESTKIEGDSEYTWLIDPLDGTNNYISGIPQFAVSISLLYREEIIMGVVYHPTIDVLWDGITGLGARRNEAALVSNYSLDQLGWVVAYMRGYDIDIENEIEATIKLKGKAKRVLSNWSPALDWCALAERRISGIVSVGSGGESQAAGVLIAVEAGAKITCSCSDNAEPHRGPLIASMSCAVHNHLLSVFH